mmetsp:Transcript_22498/g.71958  ORF Transcript_22498/g.71958 Transcript_22498/m.71958 type:complete len:218 (+) Transcript_22498:215-868(+)
MLEKRPRFARASSQEVALVVRRLVVQKRGHHEQLRADAHPDQAEGAGALRGGALQQGVDRLAHLLPLPPRLAQAPRELGHRGFHSLEPPLEPGLQRAHGRDLGAQRGLRLLSRVAQLRLELLGVRAQLGGGHLVRGRGGRARGGRRAGCAGRDETVSAASSPLDRLLQRLQPLVDCGAVGDEREHVGSHVGERGAGGVALRVHLPHGRLGGGHGEEI